MRNPSKEQVKAWNKTYYEKTKEKHGDARKRWKKELLSWYEDIKSTLSCDRCGFSHPAALQFHHLDPNEKELDVSTMIQRGFSRDKILLEISKCQVLCANCHAILHYETRQQNIGSVMSTAA